MTCFVDAHQHFWNLEQVQYAWLTPAAGILYRSYLPDQLEPLLRQHEIAKTVLVQAANTLIETEYMLSLADQHDWIGAVIGWVPLDQSEQARAALQRFTRHPRFRGVRHLIHNEADKDWLLRPEVLAGLAVLEELNLVCELPAVFPAHLEHVPFLAARFPRLKLVIDHLAKPPIHAGPDQPQLFERWSSELARSARFPNVYAKLSGLNTAVHASTWSARDLRPCFETALEKFGAQRLIFGSDWPVCLLAGDYSQVWNETRALLEACSTQEQESILGGTAMDLYSLQ